MQKVCLLYGGPGVVLSTYAETISEFKALHDQRSSPGREALGWQMGPSLPWPAGMQGRACGVREGGARGRQDPG